MAGLALAAARLEGACDPGRERISYARRSGRAPCPTYARPDLLRWGGLRDRLTAEIDV